MRPCRTAPARASATCSCRPPRTLVDPIPTPRNARAALKDPIYADKWRLAMEANVKGKFIVNKAWEYVNEIPAGTAR